jgi:signal transduction histidine kinase
MTPARISTMDGAAAPPPAGIVDADLAAMAAAFSEAAARLQAAHESLRADVARLQRELREANAQVERSARLASLGEMAAGIAHEVRNPLGSIRLFARILEEELADRPAERDLARKILASVRGLDAVVVDVLAFAREMRLAPEEIDASSLLDRALEEALAAGAGGGAIEVRRLDRRRAPVRVRCDAALAHRALVNVVRNATEAMSESGPPAVLSVDAARREVLGSDGSTVPMAALVVQDTGPGVTDEVLRKMFNPFFTTRACGTGLGLAIVHRIMDAHGGRVMVRNAGPPGDDGSEGRAAGGPDNRGGRGAVVELMFPAAVAAPTVVRTRESRRAVVASAGRKSGVAAREQEAA